MSNKEKISDKQFKILVIMCYVGTSILIIPGEMAKEAKQDAWIAVIIGFLLGLPIIWIYSSLGKYLQNMTFVEYTEKLLGKWLGKIVSLSFVFFCFINSASLLYIVGDFVTTQIMPETPIQFTNILFIIVVIMGIRLGLETLTRAGEILYPWVIGIFMLLSFLLLPDVDAKKIQPIFEHSFKELLRGGLVFMTYSSLTLVVLLMIFPANVNKKGNGFLKGSVVGGTMIFIITILSILVLGYDFTARNTFPTYILVKKISLADFLERMEAAIATLWIITIFFKIAIYFYGSILGLAQVLRLKDYRSLTLPMTMILVTTSLIIYPNVIFVSTWNATTWISFVLTFGFILPLILLIISRFKENGK